MALNYAVTLKSPYPNLVVHCTLRSSSLNMAVNSLVTLRKPHLNMALEYAVTLRSPSLNLVVHYTRRSSALNMAVRGLVTVR